MFVLFSIESLGDYKYEDYFIGCFSTTDKAMFTAQSYTNHRETELKFILRDEKLDPVIDWEERYCEKREYTKFTLTPQLIQGTANTVVKQ